VKYRIGIKGHLDPFWQEWFEGLQIVQKEESVTWLCGFLRDQAVLYGILLTTRQQKCMTTRIRRRHT
jgi:hypothetical protein